ncbi:hypothetical protein H6F51_03090 [Cyanobacteria bacterium FACHB-DQ100]|nr:hypothetical protein [Cyanobacteria bacterium FACHB-DQ100]
MPSTIILVRVFVETSQIELCEQAAVSVISMFEQCVGLSRKSINTYWKIPQYIEIFLEFIPKEDSDAAFQHIVDELGQGWNFRQSSLEKWAVWTPSELNKFSISDVRWASVDLIQESPFSSIM